MKDHMFLERREWKDFKTLFDGYIKAGWNLVGPIGLISDGIFIYIATFDRDQEDTSERP